MRLEFPIDIQILTGVLEKKMFSSLNYMTGTQVGKYQDFMAGKDHEIKDPFSRTSLSFVVTKRATA